MELFLKSLFVTIAGLLLASSTHPRMSYAGPPPTRYYQGETAQITVYLNDVTDICGKPENSNVTRFACVRMSKEGQPIMVLPNPCMYAAQEFYAMLACHEKAHVQGWPGDHPQ